MVAPITATNPEVKVSSKIVKVLLTKTLPKRKVCYYQIKGGFFWRILGKKIFSPSMSHQGCTFGQKKFAENVLSDWFC